MSPTTTAFELLSPAGPRARLSILIFHRVLPTPDALFPDVPDAVRFDRILEWISTWFNVLPLREAVRGLGAGTLPARAASLTFDDGYEDNVSVALPILARRGFTATFFIATGYLDGGCMWNDRIITAIRECRRDMLDLTDLDLERHPLESWSARRRAIETIIERSKYRDTAERERLADRVLEAAGAQAPTRIMMTTSGVRMLRASGMEIGAHTVSHPILSRLALEDARREIAESKETLENLIQEPVELFAYPNGRPGMDYLAAHTRLPHEAGFVAAVSTGWGTAHRTSDTMQLPRFTPWDRTRGRFALRLLQNLARRGDVVPTEATLSKRTSGKELTHA